jgi:hypothetical protein
LTLIDKLPGDQKRSARFFYEMLCDFVHPNLGSHILLVDTAEPIGTKKMRWNLRCEPKEEESLSFLIKIIAIPVRHSIRLLLHDLRDIRRFESHFGEWRRRCESAAERP